MILSLIIAVLTVDPNWNDKEWDRFVTAIREVETGGEPNDGLGAIGDNGDSIGPLQISSAYHQDAVEYDPSLKDDGKTYQNCLNDFEYSKKVVVAYMKRYAPKDATAEQMARIHNGGPNGHKKKVTEAYAEKFKKVY